MFLQRFHYFVLLLILFVQSSKLELIGFGRNQLLLKHLLDQLTHFVVFVRSELLLESNHAQQLVLIELGRLATSNGVFIFEVPSDAQSTHVVNH